MSEIDSHFIPTDELIDQANAAAAAYQMPTGWEVGREVRETSLVIDNSLSPDPDDGIDWTPASGNQAEILHVSKIDLGAMLAEQEVILRAAYRLGWTTYRPNGTPKVPMIPRRLSEDLLSLQHGQPRPAITMHIPINKDGTVGDWTISREIVIANRLPYAQANKLLQHKPESHTTHTLHNLGRIAGMLYRARHANLEDMAGSFEDEEGTRFDNFTQATLIVAESMITANTLYPLEMERRRLPMMCRNHVLPPGVMPDVTDPRERNKLARLFAKASFGTVALGHAGLNVPQYGFYTSPVRRIIDLAHHLNLAADIDNRTLPHSLDSMEEMCAHYNERIEYERKEPRQYRTGIRTPDDRGAQIQVHIDGGNPKASELALALFDSAHKNSRQLQEAAALWVVAHPGQAESVVQSAVSRGYVRLHIPGPTEQDDGPAMILEYSDNKTYRVWPGKTRTEQALALTRFLAKATAVEIPPDAFKDIMDEQKLAQDAETILRRLHQQGRITFNLKSGPPAAAGEPVVVSAIVGIGGKEYSLEGHGPSKNAARRHLTVQVVKGLDLLRNVPPIGPLPPGTHPPSPIIILERYVAKIGMVETPTYTVHAAEDGKNWQSRLQFATVAQAYDLTLLGRSKQIAKERAAFAALGAMPLQQNL